MPSKSKAQHNLMAAVAHDPAFAKKVGIKQSVGKEFASADKGKTFKRGGNVANTSRMNRLVELGRVDSEKASTSKGKKNLMAEKKRIVGEMKFAKGGAVGNFNTGSMGKVRTAAPSKDGIASKGKTKGKQIVMKSSPGTMRGGSKGMKSGGYC
jgi:hypothetical protein